LRVTSKKWQETIKNACLAAGTYRPYFDSVISILADILVKRDQVNKQYKREGSEPVVEHTNTSGSVNYVKNPLLTLYNELNTQALAYWRDLGLTPAGLKKIDEKAMKSQKKTGLSDLLKAFE